MKNYQRIIDANFNRAREGLRVLEEVARFLLNNRELTERIKEMRHKLYSLLKENGYIFSRDIKTDVGADLTSKGESKREDYLSIVQANAQRVSEALRVMEEFDKLHTTPHPNPPPQVGKEEIKALRFQLYEIEKELSILILPSLPDYPLYVIVDPEQRKKNFLSFVEELVENGAKIIQLRAKNLGARDFYSLGKKIRKITKGKSSFIVNDRIDLAILLDADGVHLGQDDLPIKEAKKIFPGKIIGISCHSENDLSIAKKENVSYISIGPIFETKIKKDKKPIGFGLIKKAKKEVDLPIVAIGGIKEENIEEVFAAGADYAAVISSIAESKEPGKKLKRLVKKIVGVGFIRPIGLDRSSPYNKQSKLCHYNFEIPCNKLIENKWPLFLFKRRWRQIMNGRIIIDPNIQHGKPVIKGTRVPVARIIGGLAGGMTKEDIVQEYEVSEEDIRAALIYAGELVDEEEFHPLPK